MIYSTPLMIYNDAYIVTKIISTSIVFFYIMFQRWHVCNGKVIHVMYSNVTVFSANRARVAHWVR